MTKFRMRPSIEFEAFRWLTDEVPDWWKGYEGTFVQVPTGTALLRNGDAAQPGDYIVCDHTGRISAVTKERFESEYVAADEPIFEVLARDQLAQSTVVHWIERARAANVPEAKIARALQRYEEIIKFQSEHPERVKTPD